MLRSGRTLTLRLWLSLWCDIGWIIAIIVVVSNAWHRKARTRIAWAWLQHLTRNGHGYCNIIFLFIFDQFGLNVILIGLSDHRELRKRGERGDLKESIQVGGWPNEARDV